MTGVQTCALPIYEMNTIVGEVNAKVDTLDEEVVAVAAEVTIIDKKIDALKQPSSTNKYNVIASSSSS